MSQQPDNEFESASKEERKSFLREYVDFLVADKKYWMIPLSVVLLLLALIVVLGSTAAAPFIYTLF
jgi:hypothetical protein